VNILITNYFIKNYTGSEINALQLCDGLRNLGVNADVATFFYDDPMKSLFKKKDINVYNLFEGNLSLEKYDILWAHHIHTINHLVVHSHSKPLKIIYSCLGPFSSLAAPPIYHNELNCILSNSRGNTEVLIAEGIQKEKIYSFPNFAPKSFFKQQKEHYSNHPAKIAIISNHPPIELKDFSQVASLADIHVDFIGFDGKPIFVDPPLLKQYDLVISIGKTAQYCFSTKIPFYCYDHFGGPGFITPDNIFISETYNYSGRAINRKLTGQEIFQDIIENYPTALTNLNFLQNHCYDNYLLEKNINALLRFIASSEDVDLEKIKENYPLLRRHHNEFLRLINYQKSLENNLSMGINEKLNEEIVHSKIVELEKEILTYATSLSWRFTRPIRKIVKMIRKLING
jgi:hypothetical protein